VSTKPTAVGALESECGTHRIAFVGDRGVGKTTIAALVASRLAERARVQVTGGATRLVTDRKASTDDGLGIEWTVEDCGSGVAAIEDRADRLDTVFVVATPETLDGVAKYERCATHHDVECFLVVNRFHESARERLRAFSGLELAEYLYDDAAISTAIADGRVPVSPEWTIEAILIEALQPDRQGKKRALEALERGEQSIVNVDVERRADAESLIDAFEAAGHDAAYFECNCQCHDGHVLARRRLR